MTKNGQANGQNGGAVDVRYASKRVGIERVKEAGSDQNALESPMTKAVELGWV